MRRHGFKLGGVALFLLLNASPALAEIWSITGGNASCDKGGVVKCTSDFAYPIQQGKTTVIVVEGPYVDHANNTVPVSGSGVSAEITQKEAHPAQGFLGSSKPAYGTIKIRIVVASNAALGNRTATLKIWNGDLTFKIKVVPLAQVTDVDVPTLNDFFTQVDVTLKGNSLKNSTVSNFSGNASDADVISTTDTEAKVRFKFPQSMAYAKARVVLKSPDGTTVKGLTDNSNTEVELVGPNAVKSISFPVSGSCGNGCFKVGDVFTIKIELVRAAKQGVVTKTGYSTPGGNVITYLMVPPGSFAEASSQAPYKSDGNFNTIRVAAGDTSTSFTLKVAGCPGPGQRPQVLIETWSDGNTNRKVSPAYKSQAFAVNCQQ